MEQNGWIALGAASALGLGALAGGAMTAATSLPLVDSSMRIAVAPISDSDDARPTPSAGSSPSVDPESRGGAASEGTASVRPVPLAPAPIAVSIATAPSPDAVDELDEPDEPDELDDSDEPDEPDELDDSDEPDEPDDSDD